MIRYRARAAQALGAHGSSRVEEPLLERFTRWRAEWERRADELEELAAGPPAPVERPPATGPTGVPPG